MLKLDCNCPTCRARIDAQFWAIVAPLIEPTASAVRHSLEAPTQWGEDLPPYKVNPYRTPPYDA